MQNAYIQFALPVAYPDINYVRCVRMMSGTVCVHANTLQDVHDQYNLLNQHGLTSPLHSPLTVPAG